jgi:hypothetical protein
MAKGSTIGIDEEIFVPESSPFRCISASIVHL